MKGYLEVNGEEIERAGIVISELKGKKFDIPDDVKVSVNLRNYRATISDEQKVEIKGFYVNGIDFFPDEKVRGRGMGNAVLNEICRIADKNKFDLILTLIVENREKVRRFYRRCDFLSVNDAEMFRKYKNE